MKPTLEMLAITDEGAEQPNQPAGEHADEEPKPSDPPRQRPRGQDGHRVQQNDHAPAESAAKQTIPDENVSNLGMTGSLAGGVMVNGAVLRSGWVAYPVLTAVNGGLELLIFVPRRSQS
jgi:hypothetical protein